jgi:hypothetical protein
MKGNPSEMTDERLREVHDILSSKVAIGETWHGEDEDLEAVREEMKERGMR